MMSARWTDRVFDDYFAPAGVLKKWIARVRRLITDNNYWQTGRDLWESKRGIITKPIENLQPRERKWQLDLPVVCGVFCQSDGRRH